MSHDQAQVEYIGLHKIDEEHFYLAEDFYAMAYLSYKSDV
jgi:hypothetical protein